MDNKPKVIVNFAPGCFDDFDGTQEELNEFIAEITRLAESGELFENTQPVEIEDNEEFLERTDTRRLLH